MIFKCICEKPFEVDEKNAIIPEHKDQDGEICAGSNQSVNDIYPIQEETFFCPLGLDDSCCATCVPQPCRAEDDDDEISVED